MFHNKEKMKKREEEPLGVYKSGGLYGAISPKEL